MKKIILGLAMLLGLGVSSQAQVFRGNTVTERTKFGIQGGMSVPYMNFGGGYYDSWGDYYSNNSDAIVGFTGGINVEIPLRNGWYLQPEANFSQMGGKYWGGDSKNNDARAKDAMNYLQVPILIKYKPMLQGFGIYFGPQYAYLLSANESYNTGAPSVNIRPASVKNEFGIVVGLEYYFPSVNDGPSFGLGLRGMTGLTNTLDYNAYPNGAPSIRNNSIFLTAGVRF